MSNDNKKSVIEIIRNDNSDYFLSEVEKLRKELFDLSKSINEEIGNLKNTDSMRYNKINYDVFKKVDVIDLRTANINETMNKKAITDEKNRRNVLSKIQELYKGTISQINEKYNSLKDVLDLLEIDNSEKINDITKSIKENLTLVDENLKKKEYELLEIFSSDLTKLNEQLSIYIDEKNRISEDNLLELEEVFTEHFENISGNIDRISENFKIELKNVNETFENVKKDINGLNNTQETNYKYILEYFSKLEENSVLLEKDLKSAINDKLDSKKFIEYIDESTKKYSLLGSDLKTLRENFTNISKNIIDKIALTTEASLNSTQIQELIIQLLEEKFNNKVETITIIKEENEEKINTIKDELKVINESIENDLSNTISNFETKFKKQISDIERQLRNFEKNGVKKEDIEQIVKDNPEMFKGEKGEIPDHKYSNGWLFFQKPDGEWGTPIKVKSNDEERRMPTFASSGGMGGGAIGGSLDKYYLTKMFDVDSTGSNTDKSILTYSASENKFVFVHKINDSGVSTSDLWTADKITSHVSGVASNYIPLSEKGAENGVAPLNVNRKIDAEYLPDSVIEYKGSWNASTNTPSLADGTGNDGDFYVTSVAGTHTFGGVSITFEIGDWVMYRGGIWKRDQNTDLSGYVKYTNNTADLEMGIYDIQRNFEYKDKKSYTLSATNPGKNCIFAKIPDDYDGIEFNGTFLVKYTVFGYIGEFKFSLKSVWDDGVVNFQLTMLENNYDSYRPSYVRALFSKSGEMSKPYGNVACEIDLVSTKSPIWNVTIYMLDSTGLELLDNFITYTGATSSNYYDYGTLRDSNFEVTTATNNTYFGMDETGVYTDKYVYINDDLDVTGDLGVDGDISASNLEVMNMTSNVLVEPTVTINGSGQVVLGSGTYVKYADSDYTLPLTAHIVSGATYTLIDNTRNYIIFDGRTDTIRVVTNRDDIDGDGSNVRIDQSQIIPIITAYREGTSVFFLTWDKMAKGLAEKMSDRLIRTQRWARESGLDLTADAGNTHFQVSAGVIWYGATRHELTEVISEEDTLFQWVKKGGTWSKTAVMGYNNLQYNDTTDMVDGLHNLTANKWVNNWIYRAVLDDMSKHCCIILSTTEYKKLSEALEEGSPKDIPPPFRSLGVLVGRITVQKSSTSPTVQTAWADDFEYANINHNDSSGLQGGDETLDEYYHLTSTQYSNMVTNAGISVDNAIARFDLATGKIIQNSTIIVNDDGSLQFDDNIKIFGDLTGQLGEPNISIGRNSDITAGYTNIAIGNNTVGGNAIGSSSNVAIGNSASAGGSIQTGFFPEVFDAQSCGIAIGCSSTAYTQGSIAIGNNSFAGGLSNSTPPYTPYDNAIAIGVGARAEAANSVAIGNACVNTRENSVQFNKSVYIEGSGLQFNTHYADGLTVDKTAYMGYDRFGIVDTYLSDSGVAFFTTYSIFENYDATPIDMFSEYYNGISGNDYCAGISADDTYKISTYGTFTSGVSGFMMNSSEEFGIGIAPEVGVKLKVAGEVEISGGGVTLDSTELLTIGTGEITHNGTEFTANDDINLGANDIQATEFRMGANAVMKFNAITNSIDFIIN